MSGSAITAYLRHLCRDMDAGRPLEPFRWRKKLAPVAIPVVLGLSLGAAGCEELVCGPVVSEYATVVPDYSQPTTGDAGDGAPAEAPDGSAPTPPPAAPEGDAGSAPTST